MDEQFFDTIYRKYNKMMFRFALSILKDENKASDQVQAVFLRLFHKERLLKTFSEKQLCVYLAVCVKNSAIDASRPQKEIPMQDDTVILGVSGFDNAEPSAENEAFESLNLTTEMLYQRVAQAMTVIPERYKDVLALRYTLNLPYREIGEIMGLSETNARQIASRARQALRRLVKGGGCE